MRAALRTILLLAVALLPAAAQRYNGHGYFYYGLDAPSGGNLAQVMSTGVGGEAFVWKGLAAGAELGYLFPRTEPGIGVGLFNANGAWHLVNRDHPGKFVPFVTAGYTLGFRGGHANLLNWGGGATYWFSRHAGLRTEIRLYEYLGPYPDHFDTSLRFAIQIR
ncbi:hypothetical protein [uncultured Paludibaculum sp.]|uniref:hypothetical protein n=1 Tax=uncultured Paludibaculum sp. TaxID=1765020 RepID=UPI002AAB7283|nr:hypothetical protein [uncultured Paludibaculum sp.]